MVVAMGFKVEVSRVAVGWWHGHGFRCGYVLHGGCGGGGVGDSRWLRSMVLVSGFEILDWQIWVSVDFVVGGLCNGGFQSVQ
nr:hypothetical protein CFP56_34568 [Quercus suber]